MHGFDTNEKRNAKRSSHETPQQAAAAIACCLVYLERESHEAGLGELAHLIGVAAQAAWESADGNTRERTS